MSKHKEYEAFIKNLATIIQDTKLNEIEFKMDGLHIKLSRTNEVAPVVHQFSNNPAPYLNQNTSIVGAVTQEQKVEVVQESHASKKGAIKSPMVGVIYTSPNPDSPAFVKVGDSVKEGDTVLLIEAMKVFNPIKAHVGGTITQILITSGETVEYDEVLLVIE